MHSAVSPPQRPGSHQRYRPDIDGLRAIAVLSVVFFHAFPHSFPGGFIGVDVFFVISGYLISSIIFFDLELNTFSLVTFYSRRVRRIFPALLLVLGFTFVFGWAVLLPDEYKQLGKHVAGGAGYVSNFLLWRESGYFDNAAETKPLLHLWSLAVEEQFYILWPLLLAFVWRRRWGFARITTAIAVASFAYNVYAAQTAPANDFYSPLTRFWELMVGGLLAYTVLHRPDLLVKRPNMQSGAGMLLLGAGLLFINRNREFPGWWALLPSAGAFLVIAAGSQAWINKTVLSNRILVWFGLISFPLYLWHWPLLAFARILAGGTPSRDIRVIVVVTAVVLAWLTYRLLERQVRAPSWIGAKNGVLVGLMAVVGFVGLNCFQRDGLPFRSVVALNAEIASGFDGGYAGTTVNECGITNAQDRTLFASCLKDSRQKPSFALLGDSKAGVLIGGLIRTSTENGRWLFIGGTNQFGAPIPVLSQTWFFKPYQKLVNTALDAIDGNPGIRTVVLAVGTRHLFPLKNEAIVDELPHATQQDYLAALDGLNATVDQIIRAGKKVVFVVDNPTLPDPKECLVRKTSLSILNRSAFVSKKVNWRCSMALDAHIALTAKYRTLLSAVQARHPDKVAVFDTTKYMCDIEENRCQPYKGGRFLYSFGDHISDYAAGLIGKDLNRFLRTY
ncbi:MAG TPA: acyltransferase family protein [Telluria sp.]|nr:acyltransferase family protein [Telluria sp.]